MCPHPHSRKLKLRESTEFIPISPLTYSLSGLRDLFFKIMGYSKPGNCPQLKIMSFSPGWSASKAVQKLGPCTPTEDISEELCITRTPCQMGWAYCDHMAVCFLPLPTLLPPLLHRHRSSELALANHPIYWALFHLIPGGAAFGGRHALLCWPSRPCGPWITAGSLVILSVSYDLRSSSFAFARMIKTLSREGWVPLYFFLCNSPLFCYLCNIC